MGLGVRYLSSFNKASFLQVEKMFCIKKGGFLKANHKLEIWRKRGVAFSRSETQIQGWVMESHQKGLGNCQQ